MNETLEFVARHGYAILFAWMALEQLGMPIPAVPLLLAAGAMAGTGRLNLGGVLLVSAVASLLADWTWYELGRRKGVRVLQLLCRISLEPDSCVRRTEQVFGRYGMRLLIVSKFIPGLTTVTPPLAGIFGMPAPQFVLYDSLGALLYVGVFSGLGFLFSAQLEQVAARSLEWGEGVFVILCLALAVYILAKLWQRRRFLSKLRTARISPEELKEKLDGGEEVFIVDLRHLLDVEADPHHIPGALHLSPDDLEARSPEIPRDRDIVLYCT